MGAPEDLATLCTLASLSSDGDVGVETDVADTSGNDAVGEECAGAEAFLDARTDLVVYTQPGLSAGEHQAIVRSFGSRSDAEVVADVDQEKTYEEFARIFADRPEIVETVTPEILPRRIELDLSSGDGFLGPRVDEISATDGVREVLTREQMRQGRSICESPVPPTGDVDPTTSILTTTIPADGPLSGEQIVGAESIVRAFLDELFKGDLAAADARLSGYVDSDARTLAGDPVLAELVAADDVAVVVTPSWSWSSALPVVTASARTADGSAVAVAFLLMSGDTYPGGPIHRVQTVDELPETETDIGPDRRFVIPGVPTEGDAVAYIGDREVPVDVDHEAFEIIVTIPEGVSGEVVLTVSAATPEYPTATAYVLDVG